MASLPWYASRLRASSEDPSYRALFDGPTPTILANAETLRIFDANAAALELYGYSREAFTELSLADLRPPEDLEGFHVIYRESTSRGGDGPTRVPGVWRHRRKDGAELQVEIWRVRLTVAGARSVAILVTDVSARVLAEAALRESEQRSRQLFDAMPLPAFVIDDASLAYLAVNAAAIELYGYTREEFLGMGLRDLRPPEDILAMELSVREPPLPMGRLARGQRRHRKKDGTIILVEITTSSIVVGGRAARLTMAEDVTGRRLLEDQLRQAQKMEGIGLLAGGVAHDFNNLLNVILASTELARRAEGSTQPVRAHLDAIEEASLRAADLTRQLLAFARKQRLQVCTIDLTVAVSELSGLLSRALGEDIAFDLALRDAPLWVRADAAQLQQTLLNLCTNARQAMPAGGRLAIHTRRTDLDSASVSASPWARPGLFAELIVRDTGAGMDAPTRARMFEPFFTTKEAGSGLGLAVVHGIVQQHQGCIDVESTPGVGTTVRVLLPLMGPPTDAGVARAEPAPAARGGREVVLVVEDQAALRNLVAQSLGDLGYDVVTAPDGQAAVDQFRARPDVKLVLLDLVMPRLGGREAYALLTALDPHVRVLFMTGYAPESATMTELAARPGVAMLDKPFTLGVLEQRVRELLDRRV